MQNYGAICVDSTGAVMAKGHKGTKPFETDATSLGATVRYVHQATGVFSGAAGDPVGIP